MIENWLKEKFVAHRGFHAENIRENTVNAFQNAIIHGYNIELDVQLTRDNIPVVFHDLHLKRLMGVDSYVRDLTYEQLKDICYIGSNDKIPAFEEVLKVCENKTGLMIEVKKSSYDEHEINIEPIIWNILKEYKGDYVLKSFNPFSVEWLLKNTSGVRIGLLSEYASIEEYDSRSRSVVEYLLYSETERRVDFFDYAVNLLGSELEKTLQDMSLIVWTVKSQKQYDEVMHCVDNIIFEDFIPQKT